MQIATQPDGFPRRCNLRFFELTGRTADGRQRCPAGGGYSRQRSPHPGQGLGAFNTSRSHCLRPDGKLARLNRVARLATS